MTLGEFFELCGYTIILSFCIAVGVTLAFGFIIIAKEGLSDFFRK